MRFYSASSNTRVRTWTLDGGVFVLGLASGAASSSPADITEQLQLWSCRISFRDHVSGKVGGADFCVGRGF